MANKKITELPAATLPLAGTEPLEIVQGGVNVQAPASAFGASSGSFVDSEVPSGSVNSSNVTFTLANTPIAGSVKLYQNGIRLKVTTDYSISGVTITFVTAPTTGDLLLTDYRK